MTQASEAHRNPRANKDILLVLIGGLGDWCIRRVLMHAIEFEKDSDGKTKVIVIDVHPAALSRRDDTFESWVAAMDGWITRRLIEQSAEDIDLPFQYEGRVALKTPTLGFEQRLAVNPTLPDPTASGTTDPGIAIAEFVARTGLVFEAAYKDDRQTTRTLVEARLRGYLTGVEKEFTEDPEHVISKMRQRWGLAADAHSFEGIRKHIVGLIAGPVMELAQNTRKRLQGDRRTISEWLRHTVLLHGYAVHRYWRSDPSKDNLYHCRSDGSRVEVDDSMLRKLAGDYRIIAYVATPPSAYPLILKQWSRYAERIAFEKPIAGLLEPV